MTNVFIVSGQELAASYSLIGFRNALALSGTSNSGDAQDQDWENALDNNDVTEQAPEIPVGSYPHSTVTTFTFAQRQNINYIGVLSRNGYTCGLSVTVEVFDHGELDFVEVCTVSAAADAVPFFGFFGDQYSSGYANTLQVRITETFLSGTPKISAIHAGEAVILPRTPSMSYQPGSMSPVSKSDSMKTYANNSIIARQSDYGYQMKATFNYIEMSDARDWYREFANHALEGRGIFVAANCRDFTDIIYGRQNVQSLTKPNHSTSFHCSISLEINGFA